MKTALVTGSSGFIGHHLVRYLRELGYYVRGADIVPPVYDSGRPDTFYQLDLREYGNALHACEGMDEVYQLAADMGGISYITNHPAAIARNNVLINANMLEAARVQGVERYFFSSSAVVYPEHLQEDSQVTALREDDAIPANPSEGGYGWEKLFSEKLTQYYGSAYGLEVRIGRFHNVYGPMGVYQGGKEKAPAAICRKVCLAPDGGEIEVWGDGSQTRSFMYIDDCIEGVYHLMQSDYCEPLNIGSEELVTISELVNIVASIAGKTLHQRFDPSKPQGVRGRNSDNQRIREVLGWAPSITLSDGLVPTYYWIVEQLSQAKAA